MTTPTSDEEDFDSSPAVAAPSPKAESFMDWFSINSTPVIIGAAIVVAVGFGYWFVQRTKYNETMSSDKALLQAKQSLNSQNQALAESDLKKLADKYGDRPAGVEAGILLAQVKMDKGDFVGAAASLKDLESKASGSANAAQISGLLGDALSQQNKTAEAAAEYEKAAGETAMVNEKNSLLSKAAASYMAGQKPADAKRIYQILAAQTENLAVAAEAHVRLGELTLGTKM